MQHPHRRWEGFRGDPWVNGLPELERARGQEPADKAENGEKTLKLLLGETRVTWRKLHCLKSNAHRSMEGLWRRRLTLMRTPIVKRQTPPKSGFFAFFPLSRAWRRRQSVSLADLISMRRCTSPWLHQTLLEALSP